MDKSTWTWLEVSLFRVACGLSTVADADKLRTMLQELEADVERLTADVELLTAVIEKEITHEEQSTCDRLPVFDLRTQQSDTG